MGVQGFMTLPPFSRKLSFLGYFSAISTPKPPISPSKLAFFVHFWVTFNSLAGWAL